MSTTTHIDSVCDLIDAGLEYDLVRRGEFPRTGLPEGCEAADMTSVTQFIAQRYPEGVPTYPRHVTYARPEGWLIEAIEWDPA